MPATKAPGSAATPHRHTAKADLQVPAARAAYMPAAYCYCNQDCSIPEIWYRILASNRTGKTFRAFCLGEEEERCLNDGSKFFVQKKGLGTRRLMVWFTYTSVILLMTLTIMVLVLPVVLPPLPPPPPVLMFLPLVILVCLLVIALVPTGFNGVVVGYMWSIWWAFLLHLPLKIIMCIKQCKNSEGRIAKMNLLLASDLQFLYGKYMQHGTILIIKPEN